MVYWLGGGDEDTEINICIVEKIIDLLWETIHGSMPFPSKASNFQIVTAHIYKSHSEE